MTDKIFLKALKREQTDKIPFWFMRQAGRYLPEYRALREKAGGFLNMAYNPDLACEITLQPIRRFQMDAAIIFSDILVIPHALGQSLAFEQGEGPKLGAFDLKSLSYDNFDKTLAPVYEALEKTSFSLNKEGFEKTALIGFAGAPWTVATYMIEGGSSRDFHKVKLFAYRDPENFQKLIDLLVEATSKYLINQIKAGAECVQIFDSWASALDNEQFTRWVIDPTTQIVQNIRKVYPDFPIIGFPRGAGYNYLAYAQKTGVTGLSLDQQVDPVWAAPVLQPLATLQGNLDPICLIAGGENLKSTTDKILNALAGGPFIFNLGHGIDKSTPVEHVEQLVKTIREFKPHG